MIRPFCTVLLTFSIAFSLFAGHDHDHGPVNVQYIENKGQWPQEVLYRTGVNGATVFLEKNGTSWVKMDAASLEQLHDYMELSPEEKAAFVMKGYAWRVRFEGASPDPAIVPMEKANGYHNYFYGNDPSKWVSEVGLFGVVKYDEVWPGIDVIYHSVEGNMKYDVVLAPGADPSLIALRYDGLDKFFINEGGNVVLQTSVGNVMEMAPVAFYSDGAREPIGSRYVLENGVLRYSLDQYDATRSVTIDPILIASTYSGSTGASNYGHCATYDAQGNIYTGARNFGPSYPVTTGAFQTIRGGGTTDMAFSKYNADGSDLIWASYLGGSGSDYPHSMIVNSDGQLCILGSTNSTNFPTTINAFDSAHNGGYDITVTVFDAAGSSLVGSTYIGGTGDDGINQGSSNYAEAHRGEIILNAADELLIASFSLSSDFPTTGSSFQSTIGGEQDAVVFGMSPTASLLTLSTYLGGSSLDAAMGIRLVDQDIIVCGYTDSDDLSVGYLGYQSSFQGATDGFVVRLNNSATEMLSGTFIGTSSNDRIYFIDTDSNDDIWIYGQTTGPMSIVPAGTWGESGGTLFVSKLTSTLSSMSISSIFGISAWGGLVSAPVAFVVDICDNIYISGYNSDPGLAVTPDSLGSNGSFYIAVFEAGMQSLLFGTYMGGNHVDGGTSRFSKDGIIYQGVCSTSNSLQTSPWAYATSQNVSWDIGVFKIDTEQAGVQVNIQVDTLQGTIATAFNFTAAGNAVTYEWDAGDGSPTLTGPGFDHIFSIAGTYTVTLIGSDPASCNLYDTAYVTVIVDPITTHIPEDPGDGGSIVWPNPADGNSLRVRTIEAGRAEIFDATGRSCIALSLMAGEQPMHLGAMAPGHYLFVFHGVSGEREVKRLIIH
jgi:hypothetical protein